jgi:hypothetical protein
MMHYVLANYYLLSVCGGSGWDVYPGTIKDAIVRLPAQSSR